MTFEVHVEDQSGKKALETLIPKIISNGHSYRIYSYKGIGKIPPKLRQSSGAKHKTLLENLPRILRAHDSFYENWAHDKKPLVLFVLDLDNNCMKQVRADLLDCADNSGYLQYTHFFFAIEEIEAWYLGDLTAIQRAYPKCKNSILQRYVNDSICGTWEVIGDAVYPGGLKKLKNIGWQHSGKVKSDWALRIPPHMNVEDSRSPSFCYFRNKLRNIITIP